ncbi:MAG TPA: tetratricopeptide repeat protein, partial [Myxococcales bacterium]|nr:tetratricopeptide repeat protein [Myxococcales bacterium]
MTNSTGKFDVVELLGSGPNGDTSLAVDTVLGRVVVLKQYTQIDNVPLEAIFQTNVNALYSITLPSFALVYSASPVGSPSAFVAREHVNGLTLDRLVGKLGATEKYYLVALVAEVACLLRDFAKAKIAHGNLKFSNLMVNQTGGVKVLDPAVIDIPKPDSDIRALGVMAYYLWVGLDAAVVDQPFTSLVSSLSDSFDPKQCLLDDPLVDTIGQCLAFNGKNSIQMFDDCIRRIDLWLVGYGRTRAEVIADGAQSLNYLFLTSGSIESTDADLAADSDAEQDNVLDYDYSLEGDFNPEVPEWDPMQSPILSSPPPEGVVDADAESGPRLPQPDNRPSLFYAPDAALVEHSAVSTHRKQSIDISQLVRIAAALLLLVLGMWAVWPDDGGDDANEHRQQQVKEEAPKVDPELLLETARKFSSGSVHEALIAARAAVEALPDHWEAQFLFGRSLMRDGAWKEAQASLVRAQQLLPERVEPHRGLVEILLQQKLNRPAAQAARRALTFHGTDARLYLLLARAEMGDRRLSEAQEALEMAVQLTPNIKHAWHLLGQVHAWQGRHKKAVTAFKSALKFEPEIADSYVGLGRSLLALGEGGDAITTLSNGLLYAPKAFELRYALGRILMI